MRSAFAGIVRDIGSIVTWHHLAVVPTLAAYKGRLNSLKEVK